MQHTPVAKIILSLAIFCMNVIVTSAQDASAPDVPLRKDVDLILRLKYTRLAEDAFIASATPDNPEWDEPTRMQYWVHVGN